MAGRLLDSPPTQPASKAGDGNEDVLGVPAGLEMALTQSSGDDRWPSEGRVWSQWKKGLTNLIQGLGWLLWGRG